METLFRDKMDRSSDVNTDHTAVGRAITEDLHVDDVDVPEVPGAAEPENAAMFFGDGLELLERPNWPPGTLPSWSTATSLGVGRPRPATNARAAASRSATSGASASQSARTKRRNTSS